MTMLKKALLNDNKPAFVMNNSTDEEDAPDVNLNNFLEVKEPLINQRKQKNYNESSFCGSYTENKFSTSFFGKIH